MIGTIAEATEPPAVIAAATGLIDPSLPDARKAIQEEVTRSAPCWAANLSKRARERMPALRAVSEHRPALDSDAMRRTARRPRSYRRRA